MDVEKIVSFFLVFFVLRLFFYGRSLQKSHLFLLSKKKIFLLTFFLGGYLFSMMLSFFPWKTQWTLPPNLREEQRQKREHPLEHHILLLDISTSMLAEKRITHLIDKLSSEISRIHKSHHRWTVLLLGSPPYLLTLTTGDIDLLKRDLFLLKEMDVMNVMVKGSDIKESLDFLKSKKIYSLKAEESIYLFSDFDWKEDRLQGVEKNEINFVKVGSKEGEFIPGKGEHRVWSKANERLLRDLKRVSLLKDLSFTSKKNKISSWSKTSLNKGPTVFLNYYAILPILFFYALFSFYPFWSYRYQRRKQ